MNLGQVMEELKTQADPTSLSGMARYGINVENALGVKIPCLQALAKKIGNDHSLALELWDTGINESRILAAMVEEPNKVDQEQMNAWVKDLNSWDVCDQVCNRLFDYTDHAWQMVEEWSSRPEEFVKRAAFTMMATLAVHDKVSGDSRFEALIPLIKRESSDSRNYVRKAVNWALRQIGKRSRYLNSIAIRTAHELETREDKTSRWIARDALRELTGEKVQARFFEIERPAGESLAANG